MRRATRPGGFALRGSRSAKVRGTFQSRKASDTVASYVQEWDWGGNIKPQIDAAVALGANALHLSMVASAIPSGYLTLGQMQARMKQQFDYTASLGIPVYLGLLYTIGDVNSAPARSAAADLAQYATAWPHVLGFDVCNEINLHNAVADATGLPTYISALRAVTALPLTASLSITSSSGYTSDWVQFLSAYVDFYDFHPYYPSSDPAPSDLTSFRNSTYYKTWIIGECGQSRAAGSTAVHSRWQALGLLASEPDCRGAFGYTLLDFIDDYGIYSTSLATTANTDMTTAFSAWPGPVRL